MNQCNNEIMAVRLLILFLLLTSICPFTLAQQPVITNQYTADPSARVFNDTLYLYPSHDKENAKWFNMSDWHVFSSTDMKNWTDYGVALSLDSIKWATKYAWAPDCLQHNGQYFFYFPADRDYIGVAVSNTPYGPFKDAIGKPLITRQTPGVMANRALIDPCLFMDDDNTPYLIFGQNYVNIVKLNDNMISFSDTVRTIKGVSKFFEAPWMHKYNGKYYLSYSGKPKLAVRAKIHYAISDSPYGPFEHKGIILDKVNSGTNHSSIVAYKGQWYLFYHNSNLYFTNNPNAKKINKKKWYRRSVSVDELIINKNGTIQKIRHNKNRVKKNTE